MDDPSREKAEQTEHNKKRRYDEKDNDPVGMCKCISLMLCMGIIVGVFLGRTHLSPKKIRTGDLIILVFFAGIGIFFVLL